MNKKNILKTMAVAAIATLAMTSCNQSAPKVDAKSDAAQPTSKEMKIAYVEVDSIMSQYQFCKDYSMVLQKKGQNIQNTLATKQQQLQAAAANFQQKVQQNAYSKTLTLVSKQRLLTLVFRSRTPIFRCSINA